MNRGITALALLMLWIGTAVAQPVQFGDAAPKDAPKIALAELIKSADAYKGKLVQVEGTLVDVCADGDDFYFKDKFDLIEVEPPAGAELPYGSKKGSRITVYGTVRVRHRGNDVDVRIEAKGVAFP